MAYPYPYYNSYMGQYYVPQTPYNAPQTQNAGQVINNTPAQNSGLVWVQGESGAKSYMVAPGSTVLLMDSESQKFYIKSADASGMPMPLRVFEYAEKPQNASESAKIAEVDKYITRDEFERRMAEIASRPIKKKSEAIADE